MNPTRVCSRCAISMTISRPPGFSRDRTFAMVCSRFGVAWSTLDATIKSYELGLNPCSPMGRRMSSGWNC